QMNDIYLQTVIIMQTKDTREPLLGGICHILQMWDLDAFALTLTLPHQGEGNLLVLSYQGERTACSLFYQCGREDYFLFRQ
ncbi:MAG: hypothetical protein AAB110_09930, partial [Candidatus Desantisbacteria bacterium]